MDIKKELNKSEYDLTSYQVDQILKLFSQYEKEVREKVLGDFLEEIDKEYESFVIDEAVGKIMGKLRKKYALLENK